MSSSAPTLPGVSRPAPLPDAPDRSRPDWAGTPEDDAPARGAWRSRDSLTALGAVAVALLVWGASLTHVNLRAITDVGLISVLPGAYFLALGVLSVSFALCLRRRPISDHVVIVHVLALVLMLYATTSLIEPVSRFAVTYRHVGITDVILRTGEVKPNLDAYFNWPGFFIFSAFLTKAAGLHSVLVWTKWCPLFFNLLYLGPLLMIMRSGTDDRRLIWLAVWVFYLSNWVGQDYFSPQGLVYFIYLVFLAVTLRWLAQRSNREPGAKARFTAARRMTGRLVSARRAMGLERVAPATRGGLVVLLVVLFIAATPAHQLTPFAMLGGIVALVVFRRCTARGLPAIMLVIVAAWMTYETVSYLKGHFGALTGTVGQLDNTINQSVTARLTGSAGHLFAAHVRLALTAALFAAAALGGVRRLRRGEDVLPFALLCLTPYTMLGLQAYGGEILLRAFLFSLPFLAFFAAAAVYPSPWRGRSMPITALISVGLIGLGPSFIIARYGNERMDSFSKQEVRGVEHMYDIAPHGSQLLAGAGDFPWKLEGYDQYKYKIVAKLPVWTTAKAGSAAAAAHGPDIPRVVRALRLIMNTGQHQRSYLIITRAQMAESDLLGPAPVGSLARLEQGLVRSPAFRVAYRNPDVTIFVLSPAELAHSPKRGQIAAALAGDI